MHEMTTERNADNIVEEPPEEPTREELLHLVFMMTKDFVRLNEFLNQTAIQSSWCEDYETRLRRYNKAFEVMRLEGRQSADFQKWEEDTGRSYQANYHDQHKLADEAQKAAETSADQRTRWEFARLMADLSIKGPVKEKQPEVVKVPAFGETVQWEHVVPAPLGTRQVEYTINGLGITGQVIPVPGQYTVSVVPRATIDPSSPHQSMMAMQSAMTSLAATVASWVPNESVSVVPQEDQAVEPVQEPTIMQLFYRADEPNEAYLGLD